MIKRLSCFKSIFNKIKFTSMFEFFIDHELFPVRQSGFLPGASLISQLLKYTWNTKIIWWKSTNICKGAFLDIFWHKGLVSKLKSYGMSNNLISFHWLYLFLEESSFWCFPRISLRKVPFLHILTICQMVFNLSVKYLQMKSTYFHNVADRTFVRTPITDHFSWSCSVSNTVMFLETLTFWDSLVW